MAQDLTAHTADVVAAYLVGNQVPRSELRPFINEVYRALAKLERSPASEVGLARLGRSTASGPVQAGIPVADTIRPDHLISLEDGRPYKTLKRHLGSHGLTPDTYRAKWGLPPDYPMVAPSYSARRSELIKSSRLRAERWPRKKR